MDVNNTLIQPEAWDFSKAKLTHHDQTDRGVGKTTSDKPVGDAVQEGTHVTLSAIGLALSRSNESQQIPDILVKKADKDSNDVILKSNDNEQQDQIDSEAKKSSEFGMLSAEEKKDLNKLRLRDMEVRAQIQAHLASAGKYSSGGVNYEFERGPDGQSYATRGEVNIDIPEGKTPEENLRIAIQVERAATSSPRPTQADRTVSSAARRKAALARKEILENAIRRGSQEFVIIGSGNPSKEEASTDKNSVGLPGNIAADAYIVNSKYNGSSKDENIDTDSGTSLSSAE